MQADGSTQGTCHSLDRTSIEKCNNTLVVVLCGNRRKFKKMHHFGELVEKLLSLDFDDSGICRKVQHFE